MRGKETIPEPSVHKIGIIGLRLAFLPSQYLLSLCLPASRTTLELLEFQVIVLLRGFCSDADASYIVSYSKFEVLFSVLAVGVVGVVKSWE